MIRKREEQAIKLRPNMYQGEGEVQVRSLLAGADEMNEKGRLFSLITIPVGASIGPHPHQDETETFYIVSGTAEYNDDGTLVSATAGDVLQTPAGGSHSIRNTGDAPLELVALILYV